MTALLSAHQLTAGYGDGAVLHGLDFEIQPGSVTTLLGANGAGKTTVLRALSGLLKAEGAIVLNGETISNLLPEEIARKGVSHVPEGRGTFSRLTVEENLQLGAISRKDQKEITKDIQRVYSYFPVLERRRKQQAGTLSGGEQQMLAVGRALMLRPTLMLLDEPSFGLAPLVVQMLFETLASLKRETGVAILIVEQNAELALEFADHAYLLEAGRIVLSGDARTLREDEKIRHAYLGY